MNTLLASLRHGFGNLANFKGRDTRAQFWPFALLQIAALLVLWAPFFLSEFVAAMERMQAFAKANPDKATIIDEPGRYSITINDPVPGIGPDLEAMLWPLAVLVPVFIALIAAATVRRLHDIGWPGWVGLVPAILFFASGWLMFDVFTSLNEGAGQPDSGTFLTAFALTFAYNISLIGLLIACLWPTRPQNNRYGPAPL